jgi:hypothetical protein
VVRIQEQDGEQCAALHATELERIAVAPDLERSEKSEVELVSRHCRKRSLWLTARPFQVGL